MCSWRPIFRKSIFPICASGCEMYRRIADIRSNEDSLDVTDELIDRFGEPPESVNGLIEVALLRNRASALGVYEVKQKGDSILLYKDSFDMKQVAMLVSHLKRRVMVNAGAKPYISVKLSGTPLDTLQETLELLEKAVSDTKDTSSEKTVESPGRKGKTGKKKE